MFAALLSNAPFLKFTPKILLLTFTSIVVVIFNEFKYRWKHLSTLSSCITVPKHSPKILYSYQFFSLYFYLCKILVYDTDISKPYVRRHFIHFLTHYLHSIIYITKKEHWSPRVENHCTKTSHSTDVRFTNNSRQLTEIWIIVLSLSSMRTDFHKTKWSIYQVLY